MKPHIAVIGAGVAGLAAARRLAPMARVTLFEKSRGVGGRLANRRTERFAFDFGAQFFTARNPAFRAEVESLAALRIVSPWRGRFVEITGGAVSARSDWDEQPPHFVGVGRMTAMASAWAEGLTIERMTRITAVTAEAQGWRLESEQGAIAGLFDFVVIAIPAPQAAALLPPCSPLAGMAAGVAMTGCFALMLGFETLPDLGFDAAMIRNSPLNWLSVCRSRPGHAGAPGLVALSDNDWADRHMEDSPESVADRLLDALAPFLRDAPAPLHRDLHRWRYANCGRREDESPLVDAANRLALCGDWTLHGRVEAAYLSGLRIAEQVVELLGLDQSGLTQPALLTE